MNLWDHWYRLDGKTPVLCKSDEEAISAMRSDRHVGDTKVGDIWVSTVFLCMDHGFGRGSDDEDYNPVLFETMIFGGPHDQEYCERYCTWDEAVRGHREACKVAFGYVPYSACHKGKESFIESVVNNMLEEQDG